MTAAIPNLLQTFTGNGFKVWLGKPKAKVNSSIFRLYKITACFLAIASSLSMGKVIFGDPITCVPEAGVDEKYINDFCWCTGTVTYGPSDDPSHEISPGISFQRREGKRVHSYYQWVGLFLTMEGIIFASLPYVWKIWEGGRVDRFLSRKTASDKKGETGNSPSLLQLDMERIGKIVASQFGQFRLLGERYLMLEIFALGCIFNHFLFSDWMLQIDFLSLGYAIFFHYGIKDPNPNSHPSLQRLFPRQTTCTVKRFGPGGNVINTEAMCIIPLNVMNEKIFAFLWVYMLFVALLATIHLFWTSALVAFHYVRRRVFKCQSPFSKPNIILIITMNASWSDWLMTYLVITNIDNYDDRRLFLHGMATSYLSRPRKKPRKKLTNTPRSTAIENMSGSGVVQASDFN